MWLADVHDSPVSVAETGPPGLADSASVPVITPWVVGANFTMIVHDNLPPMMLPAAQVPPLIVKAALPLTHGNAESAPDGALPLLLTVKVAVVLAPLVV